MFTKQEAQLIAQTLTQRREWLVKNMANPDLASHKAQHQQTLEVLDSALAKLVSTQKPAAADTQQTSKRVPVSIAQKRAQMEPSEIKVLVVDDDTLISSMMKVLLESYGVAHIDTAQDGLQAITMLYDANPVYDLVLCDWNMPIKNGLDVHNAMRAAERYMDTCFMLVTAVTEAKQIRAAIEEGVDDYIVKPIEEQKIIKKFARHFPKFAK
ncbi:response regulator [Cellvibrio sp.]|uniref:response regulator n=1 Tax=Cellvibrio sp. TaxID=1965322 RepID=UPI0039648384